jgi:hypothetical protein
MSSVLVKTDAEGLFQGRDSWTHGIKDFGAGEEACFIVFIVAAIDSVGWGEDLARWRHV